jgi:hypothetical protein
MFAPADPTRSSFRGVIPQNDKRVGWARGRERGGGQGAPGPPGRTRGAPA